MGLRKDPSTIAILPTFRCTAECSHCCFKSSPRDKYGLSLEVINAIILHAISLFEAQVVVLSGGEATIDLSRLTGAIGYATRAGLSTRLVSNACWASTHRSAQRTVKKLLASGLTEINFSTGHNHAGFVPICSVLNAVRASIENGLATIVVIEDAPGTQDFLKEFTEFATNPLFSLSVNAIASLEETEQPRVQHGNEIDSSLYCDSILSSIAFTADGLVYPCCGLALRQLPGLSTCSIDTFLSLTREEFFSLLYSPRNALLLLESFQDIVNNDVLGLEKETGLPAFVHPCEACSWLGRNSHFFHADFRPDQRTVNNLAARLALLWIAERPQECTGPKSSDFRPPAMSSVT